MSCAQSGDINMYEDDSDEEAGAHDAYLERMKAEGKDRDSDAFDDDSDSSGEGLFIGVVQQVDWYKRYDFISQIFISIDVGITYLCKIESFLVWYIYIPANLQWIVPQFFKLLPKRHIFFDLVIRFITNRKYAFFCIF